MPAPTECLLEQIGFDDDEALLPDDKRIFRGFDLLREYFMLPAQVPRLPRSTGSTR